MSIYLPKAFPVLLNFSWLILTQMCSCKSLLQDIIKPASELKIHHDCTIMRQAGLHDPIVSLLWLTLTAAGKIPTRSEILCLSRIFYGSDVAGQSLRARGARRLSAASEYGHAGVSRLFPLLIISHVLVLM